MNINNWKNLSVFKKQLQLNLAELENYPAHWRDFIDIVSSIPNTESLLDIGCGCGVYYKLCQKELPYIKYTGIDYADEAILLAKETWNYDNFFTYNFWNLTSLYISLFDIVHCGAIFDIFPNGDQGIEKLLSLNPKRIIISRIKLTDKNSYTDEYLAYDTIKTYAYYHNINNLKSMTIKFNYSIQQINDILYLEKQ